MSATTEVILAAGPTIVAVVAIGTAARQQKRGFSHEREMADLADARALTDEAAIALHRVSYARGKVAQDFMTHGEWIAERAPETVKSIFERGEAMDAVRERLAVRFGVEHALVKQFDAANASLLTVARKVNLPQDVMDGRETWDAIKTEGERFNEARRLFMAAAAATVGVRLTQA